MFSTLPGLSARNILDVDLHVPGASSRARVRIVKGREVGSKVHLVERITPASSRKRLEIPADVALVVKQGIESGIRTARREAALAAVHGHAEANPREMIGLVPLYAMGTRRHSGEERYAREYAGIVDPVTAFDLMPYAGQDLSKAITTEGPGFWGAGGHAAAVAAMLPSARALRGIHSLNTDEKYGSVAAHRDIKPSNLFVLDQRSPHFAGATRRAGPWADMPLVRIGDFGLLYFSSADPDSTSTHLRPRSGYWSAPEDWRRESQKEPHRLDVWSYAATLFFALTGEHPWKTVEEWRRKGLDPRDAAEYMWTQPIPDNPLFSALDPTLADTIRECLAPVQRRPRIGEVVEVMEQYASEAIEQAQQRAEESKKPPGEEEAVTVKTEPEQANGRDPSLRVAAGLGALLLLLIALVPLASAATVGDGWQVLGRAWADLGQLWAYGGSQETAKRTADLVKSGYHERDHGVYLKTEPDACKPGEAACYELTMYNVLSLQQKDLLAKPGEPPANGRCPRATWIPAFLADKDGNVLDTVTVVESSLPTGQPVTAHVGFKHASASGGDQLYIPLVQCAP